MALSEYQKQYLIGLSLWTYLMPSMNYGTEACGEPPPEFWESLINLGCSCGLDEGHEGDHWYEDDQYGLTIVVTWENKKGK